MVTTGDNNQLLPGNNIAASSSPSSNIPGSNTNTSNTSTNPTSGTPISESEPGKPGEGAVDGCPPPHPGKHEGKPSTTWTPPFVGNTSNPTQVGY